MSANVLKVIAILSMLIDHTAVWLVPEGTILNQVTHTIGRLAAPIMCYLIAEGYFHTSNIKKYMLRLFYFSLLSHFPCVLFFEIEWWQGTSVIWCLLLGLIALAASQHSNLSLIVKLSIILSCCLLAWTADWNYIGVLWVLFFGLFRQRLPLQMISFALIGCLFYIYPGLSSMGEAAAFRFGILFVIPLLFLYNGKRGKKSSLLKWGFYVFYPLHLFVLYLFKDYIFA